MSLEGYLIAAALILIAIDIFVASDIPTHISYVIFAYVISKDLPFHFMYRILAGIGIWFLLICFHYLIWKKIIAAFLNKYISPEKKAAGIASLVGSSGEIREIEGKMFVRINEELMPFTSRQKVENGSTVRICDTKDGVLIVERIK